MTNNVSDSLSTITVHETGVFGFWWGGVGRDKSLLLHINYSPRPKHFSFFYFFGNHSSVSRLRWVTYATAHGPARMLLPIILFCSNMGPAVCSISQSITDLYHRPTAKQTATHRPFATMRPQPILEPFCASPWATQWAWIIRLLLLFRNTCQNLYIRFGFYLLEVTKRSDYYLFFFFSSPSNLFSICRPPECRPFRVMLITGIQFRGYECSIYFHWCYVSYLVCAQLWHERTNNAIVLVVVGHYVGNARGRKPPITAPHLHLCPMS